MVGFGKLIVVSLLIVMAMELFPMVHLGVINLDMTSWLPLNALAVTILPYAFFGVVIYIILKH